jgi:hypothetical protein
MGKPLSGLCMAKPTCRASLSRPANRVIYSPIDRKTQRKAQVTVSRIANEMIIKGNYREHGENGLLEKAFSEISGKSLDEIRKMSIAQLDLNPELNDGWEAIHQALDGLKGGAAFGHGPRTPLLSEHFKHGEGDSNGYLSRFMKSVAGFSKPLALAAIGTILVAGTLAYTSFQNGNSHEPNEPDNPNPVPIDKTLDANNNGIPDYLEVDLDQSYVDRLVGLSKHEKAALVQRTENGENLATGDFDRDGSVNVSDTHITDPSDSHATLKEESVEYVEKLVEYHDGHNPESTTPEIYGKESLKKAVDLVEARPQMVSDLDSFGADALPRILSDKNIGEILGNVGYQSFVHAATVKAQRYFYDAASIWSYPKNGKMLNEQLDSEEMEIIDQRWQDRDIILADGESRLVNIGERILNTSWFVIDGETGNISVNYDSDNTDTWIEVARKNARICPQVREELLSIINDPLKQNELLSHYYNFMDVKEWGESGQRFSKYWNIILNDGDESDKGLLTLVSYTHKVKPAEHEVYVGASKLFASFLGETVYRSEGTVPVTGNEKYDGGPDGKPAPVFSDKAMEAISRQGNPTIDEETGAMPIIYGVEEGILDADKVEYVEVVKDTETTLIYEDK